MELGSTTTKIGLSPYLGYYFNLITTWQTTWFVK